MIPALCTKRSRASGEPSRMLRASSPAKVSTIARTLSAEPRAGGVESTRLGIVLNHRRFLGRVHSDPLAQVAHADMTGREGRPMRIIERDIDAMALGAFVLGS